jgi:hypothetical protein
MKRREFTKTVKLDAWNRCGGSCERCTARLYPGKFDYHHDKDDTFGGAPTLDNCVVLCDSCHSTITRDRAPIIAKSNRVRARHLGARRPKYRWPHGKDSPTKRKLDGTIVRRNRDGEAAG